MKHIIGKNRKQQDEFLESLYNDLMECHLNGCNSVCIELSATLTVAVVNDDGTVLPEEKILIKIRITNIDALGENMAETLGSMVGSLLNENNIGEFDYSLTEFVLDE